MSSRSSKRRRQDNGIRPFFPSPVDFTNCESWAKCTDDTDSDHMFSRRDNPKKEDGYNFPGGKGSVCLLYNRICWRNARMKSIIHNSNWHHILQVQEKDNDRCLAYALIERWWHTTHTFHLPLLEVGFTPVDFVSLTGVSVGLGDPVPWESFCSGGESDDVKEARTLRATALFPEVKNLMEKDKKGINCAKLGKWLKNVEIPTVEPGSEELTEVEIKILRAFFLFVIGEVWFPINKKFIPCELIGAVEDVTRVGCYDWGSAIMANMYYSLDLMARKKLKTAQFCWTLLQYWYYEHIGNPVPPLEYPDRDLFPLILKWAPSARAKCSQSVAHKTVTYRLELEGVTANSFKCRPHSSSEICIAQEIVQVVEFLSLKRHIFVHGDYARVFYLGERLAYQMLGEFWIPCPPPRPMAISDAEYATWASGYDDEQGTHHNIFPADTTCLRLACTEEKYDAYWSNASLGFLLGLLFKHRNAEHVNPAPLRDPSFVASGSTYPPDYQGMIQTQEPIDDLSRYMSSCDIRCPGRDPVTLVPVDRSLPPYATNDAWNRLSTHEQGLVHAMQKFYYEELDFALRERDHARRCRERMQRRYDWILHAADDANASCDIDVDDDSPPPTRTRTPSEHTGASSSQFMTGTSSSNYSQDLSSDL